MTTRIDVINRALIEIGARPVQDGVPPADARVLEYETHIGSLVSRYPWTFQTSLTALARLVAPPEVHWKYVYDLPSDMTGAPRAVYPDRTRRRPTQDYDIRGRHLFTDHAEIWLRYTLPPLPARWPGYFLDLAVLILKAQFALSVREDRVLRRELLQEAFGTPGMMEEGGRFGEAKKIDASGHPSDVIEPGINPLAAVRVT